MGIKITVEIEEFKSEFNAENYNDAIAMLAELFVFTDRNCSVCENEEEEHTFPNQKIAAAFLGHCGDRFFGEIGIAINSYSKHLDGHNLTFGDDEVNLSTFIDYLQTKKNASKDNSSLMAGLIINDLSVSRKK